MTSLHPAPDERVDTVNDGLRLIQKKGGLTFGTDAYLLAAYLRPMPWARAVDLGCGTGIISLLAAQHHKFASITAVEIQPAFAELTKRNIIENGMQDRIQVLCRDIIGLMPDDIQGEVDVVFANPPYMTTDSGKRNQTDEKYIARHEVCGTVFDFCAAAGRLLRHGGLFYAVFRPDRLADLFAALRGARLEPKRMTLVQSDAETAPSMLLLEAKKGAAPGLVMDSALILYKNGKSASPRVFSDRAQDIYRNCQF